MEASFIVVEDVLSLYWPKGGGDVAGPVLTLLFPLCHRLLTGIRFAGSCCFRLSLPGFGLHTNNTRARPVRLTFRHA